MLVSAIESLGFFLRIKFSVEFSFDFDHSRVKERIELFFSRVLRNVCYFIKQGMVDVPSLLHELKKESSAFFRVVWLVALLNFYEGIEDP